MAPLHNTLGIKMVIIGEKGMFLGICVGENGGEECRNKLQENLADLEGQVSRSGRRAAQELFENCLSRQIPLISMLFW